MPRIGPRGVVAGVAAEVSIDRIVIAARGTCACWASDTDVMANVSGAVSDGWALRTFHRDTNTTSTQFIPPFGANELAAGGNRWLAWLAEVGVYNTARRVWPAAGLAGVGTDGRGAAGRDGTLGVILDRQRGTGVQLWPATGHAIPLPDAAAGTLAIASRDVATWIEGGQIRAYGMPDPAPQAELVVHAQPIAIGGAFVLLVTTNDRVWLRHWDEAVGVIVVPGPFGFAADARAFDAVTVRVCWSTTPGERPQDIEWTDVRLVDLIDAITPPIPDPKPEPPMSDVPNRREVVDAEWAKQPADGTDAGNLAFCRRVVTVLHAEDPRWGLNWKRGRVGSRSVDIAAWRVGPADTDARIVDIIAYGDEPQNPNFGPQWFLHSIEAAGAVRWYWEDTAEPLTPPIGTHMYIGGGHDTGICDECDLSRFDPIHAIPESKRLHGYDGGEQDTGLCDICQLAAAAPIHQTVPPVDPPDNPPIGLPDHYYILGDGNLYARHLFRREGATVKLVAIIIDAGAAERIISALSA